MSKKKPKTLNNVVLFDLVEFHQNSRTSSICIVIYTIWEEEKNQTF